VTQTAAPPPPGLETPLQFLRGVGPHRAAQLEKKGLRTVEDALFFLPLRHEDRTRLTSLRALEPGHTATCAGTIVGLSPPPPGRTRQPFTVMLRDESGHATASWFGWRYLARVLKRGQRLVLHGRVARASRVFVGQHKAGGLASTHTPDELIGADEAKAAAAAVTEALADTVPIDEATMRELFGTGDDPEPK